MKLHLIHWWQPLRNRWRNHQIKCNVTVNWYYNNGQQRVNNWLDYNAEILLMGTDRDDFNPTPWSNWNGLYRSTLGAIALTLLGEPGNYPPPPISPIMMHLHAPKHFTPGKGVPINVLEPGKIPTAWIFADLLQREVAEDPLASIGGVQKAQPEVGL